MDIGRFVDSAAIRAYLKEQNYPFSAQKAAFLAYQCKTASLEERVRAWEEIIRTMPNCSLEKTRCREEIPDFHAFLRRCSALLRRQARRLRLFLRGRQLFRKGVPGGKRAVQHL